MPAQEICRRSVRCESISLSGSGGAHGLFQQTKCPAEGRKNCLAKLYYSSQLDAISRCCQVPIPITIVVHSPHCNREKLWQFYHNNYYTASDRIGRPCSAMNRPA